MIARFVCEALRAGLSRLPCKALWERGPIFLPDAGSLHPGSFGPFRQERPRGGVGLLPFSSLFLLHAAASHDKLKGAI